MCKVSMHLQDFERLSYLCDIYELNCKMRIEGFAVAQLCGTVHDDHLWFNAVLQLRVCVTCSFLLLTSRLSYCRV